MTDDQHKIAKMNCTAHYLLYEIIMDLLEGHDTEIIRKIVADADSAMDRGVPWYLAFDGNESVREYLSTAIKENHMGDCVKMPCTCFRCIAEEFYEIPSSAPP